MDGTWTQVLCTESKNTDEEKSMYQGMDPPLGRTVPEESLNKNLSVSEGFIPVSRTSCDDYVPHDYSALSPISEERESDLFDEEISDEEIDYVGTEDDLRSLDGLVNFRISEILPTGMTPLDNSKNCTNDEEELLSEESPILATPVVMPECNEMDSKLKDRYLETQQVSFVPVMVKPAARPKSPKSILELTETALKNQGCLTVKQICDWLSIYNEDVTKREDSFDCVLARKQEQRWRRQATVESVLNCYPQFFRISQEGTEDMWMLTRTENEYVTIDNRPTPKIATGSHTNHHWKKQKLAEYRSSTPSHTVTLSMLNHTNENQLWSKTDIQDEPLNLVMKTPEEPLNLVTRPSNPDVTSSNSKSDVNNSDVEGRKVMKKTFSKVSSRAGLSQWVLKKNKSKPVKSKRQSMQSLSKKKLQDKRKLKKKRCKKLKVMQADTNKENDPTNSTKPEEAHGLSTGELEKAKDTKIKLIKVGGSYQIASHKEQQCEATEANAVKDVDDLVIDGSLHKQTSEKYQNDKEGKKETQTQQKADECEEKISRCSASIGPDKFKSPTRSNRSAQGKSSPLQNVQIITVTKGKAQDGVTVERKPIWIQIPTSSGGARIVPLVVPQRSPKRSVPNPTVSYQPYTQQMKGLTKNASDYRKKSGFPQVTEFNKTRKVFKIGEDGTISCLGTLEEVEKSGLLGNKPVVQENTGKQAEIKTASTLFAKKTEGSIMDTKAAGKPKPQVEPTSSQKRKNINAPRVIDLSVKKPKLCGEPGLLTNENISSENISAPGQCQIKSHSIVADHIRNPVSQEKASTEETLFGQEKTKNKSTKCVTSILRENVDAAFHTKLRVPVKQNVPSIQSQSLQAKKAFVMPLQQNMALIHSNNNNANETNLSKMNNCYTKEGAKNVPTKVKDERTEGKKKIRSKIKNQIKESYFANERKSSVGDQTKLTKEVRRPDFLFQAPFCPLYAIPAEEMPTANFPNGPAYYYPVRWQTNSPYPGPRYGLYNPRAMPRGYPQIGPGCQHVNYANKKEEQRNMPEHRFAPSFVPGMHQMSAPVPEEHQLENTYNAEIKEGHQPHNEHTKSPSSVANSESK